MKRMKTEQIVKLLQEGEAMLAAGKTSGEVFQKLEVSEATWLRWKKQFGGMNSDEAKRLREPAVANRQLPITDSKPPSCPLNERFHLWMTGNRKLRCFSEHKGISTI